MEENDFTQLLKEEMKVTIDMLSFDNFQVSKELLEKQLNVLNTLKELHDYKEHHSINLKSKGDEENKACLENNDLILNEEIDSSETTNENTESQTEVQVPSCYLFKRKIRGGFVQEIEGYVPEWIVRKLDLQHGDMVYATPMDSKKLNSKQHFVYEVAKKGDGEDSPERVQHNYCPVKLVAGRLVVDKSEETGEYIKLDENSYTVILDQQEINELEITEGSLIDIAYPKGKPHVAKILWNHKFEDNDMNEVFSSLPFSKKREKKDKSSTEQTLVDTTILVIGNEPKKSLYKFAIEQRGGTFLWADTKEKMVRLEAMVKKSDVVIFLLSVSGHVGMEHIKQMCKDNGIPFETTWSKGQSTLIRFAEERNTVGV